MLVKKGVPPYYIIKGNTLKYIALITQIGTNAPVASIIINEIGFVDSGRISAGSYYTELPNGAEGYIVTVSLQNTSERTIINAGWDPSNEYVYFTTFDTLSAALEDDHLVDALLEITMYQVLT